MAPTGLPVTNEQSVAFARSLAEGRNQNTGDECSSPLRGLAGLRRTVGVPIVYGRQFVNKPIVLLVIAFSFAVGSAHAQEPPHFAFPAACRLSETCWVVNYVDTDAAPERFADFRCGGGPTTVTTAPTLPCGIKWRWSRASTCLPLRTAPFCV